MEVGMASENAIRWAKAAVLLSAACVLIIAISFSGLKRAGRVTAASSRRPVADFRLSDLSGKAWRLSDHRGQIVVVNFWATWCGPCQEETPGLIRTARRYSDKPVAFVGVAMDDDAATAVPPFLREYRIPYPVVLPDSSLTMAENIDSLPTTVLLDRHGRIAKTWIGEVDENTLQTVIDELLREPA